MRIHLGACGCCSVLGALLLSACGSDAPPVNAGGGAGMDGEAGEAGMAGAQTLETAQWPMPNSPGLGLPNPADYDAETTPGVVHDLVTGLAWQQDPGTETYTRADALNHCEALSLGGFDDWRLPEFIELVSLFDVVPNVADPVDPIYISPIFGAEGRYWSASALDSKNLGRLLDFTAADCGTSQHCSISVAGMPDSSIIGGSFCVRNEQPPASSARYEINDDQVLDLQTGLTWQDVPAAVQTVDHESAVSECAALGMRLPSITELLSILVPLLDKRAFPNWPPTAFAWSSSTIPIKPDNYWVGAIAGATAASLSTSHNRVECVR